VVDHDRVTPSTVDRWRCGQEGVGVWWHAHRSRASGHSGARELIDGGKEWRTEHEDPIAGLPGAHSVVWWLGDGDKAVAEKKLDGGSTQASGEGVGVVRTDGGLLLL
jgi:hypothetical protein